jgi:putative alpha-1,2-mannosidase
MKIYIFYYEVFCDKGNDLSDENKYIQEAILNGKSLEESFINHFDVVSGGNI